LEDAPILDIDDAVGGGFRVEQADEQPLTIEGIVVQVEVVLELPAHAPQAIDGAVGERAVGDRLLGIE